MIRAGALLVVPALVLAAAACRHEAAAPQPHELWTCSMHPQYVADKPGDCPICGMKLVRKQPAATHADGGIAAAPGVLQLAPERQRLIGVKTIAVTRAPLAGGIRAAGRVTIDERRVHRVTARFDGYIERLDADFTGKLVQKGEPLLSIYSPDVLATEQELLLAARSEATLAQSGLPDAARAARDRLRLFGISDGDLERVEKSGRPERALPLRAPIAGFITSKSAVAGAKVRPDDALFEITDLSRVWVVADVYEYELPRLALGQTARFSLPYWPGRTWRGKVSYILPTVDDKTRTVKVRLELGNPDHALKPDMFGDVVIDTAPRTAIVIPDDAVIVTGTRKLAFAVLDDGRLVPRAVETGLHVDGKYEVTAGLVPGDKVAGGASFLLDSEAQLRSALGDPAAALDAVAPPPDGGRP